MPDYSHLTLMTIKKQLGYKPIDEVDDGICAGLAQMGIQAFLCGNRQFNHFLERLNFIADNPDFFSNKNGESEFEKVKKNIITKRAEKRKDIISELIKNKEPIPNYVPVPTDLTREEQDILEIAEFFDGVEIYLSPGTHAKAYAGMFDQPLRQNQLEEISKLVESEKLKKEGGLINPLSFEGIYTKEQVSALAKIFNTASKKQPMDFALALTSDNHRVALFRHGHSWFLLDANNLPMKNIPEKLLGKVIFEVFESTHKGAQSTGFTTQLCVTGKNKDKIEKFIHKLINLPDFKNLHAVNDENLKMTDRKITREWLAAMTGNAAVLVQSMRSHSEIIDEPNADGLTPLMVACFRNMPLAIQALVDAKKEDKTPSVNLNQIFQNTTPLMAVTHEGFNDCVQVLLDAEDELEEGKYRVDVNLQNDKGQTAVHTAINQGNDEALRKLAGAKTHDGKPRANLDLATNNEVTPAYLAVAKEKLASLKILEEFGAAVEIDVTGSDLPALAKRKNLIPIVKFYESLAARKTLISQIEKNIVKNASPESVNKFNALKKIILTKFQHDHEQFLSPAVISQFKKDIASVEPESTVFSFFSNLNSKPVAVMDIPDIVKEKDSPRNKP
jgi:ankyrin repeat protein